MRHTINQLHRSSRNAADGPLEYVQHSFIAIPRIDRLKWVKQRHETLKLCKLMHNKKKIFEIIITLCSGRSTAALFFSKP